MKTQIKFKTILAILWMVMVSYSLSAQIRGDQNVIRKSRNVGTFHSVVVKNGIDAFIQQGNTQSIEIETDNNLHEYLMTEVNGGVLKIYFDRNISSRRASNAYITVTDLKLLEVSGGGDVESTETIKVGDIEISVSGGGDLNFDLEANNLECNVSGGGDAEMATKAQSVKINISGGGDLDLGAEAGNFEGTISGGGDADIALGAATKKVQLNISGGGDLDLGTEAENISVMVTGGGDADIAAGSNVDKAHIVISGGGDLDISTQARMLDIKVTGGGDIEAAGSAEDLNAEVRDGSDMYAQTLKVTNATVTLSGGSTADLFVTGNMEVSASGGGNIYIKGNPNIRSSNLSGGSKIINK